MTLDTRTLATRIRSTDGSAMTVSDATPTALGTPSDPAPSTDDDPAGAVHWEYPESGVGATAAPDPVTGGLTVHLTAGTGTDLAWPRTGTDETVGTVQYANGSGQDIPISDRFWNDPASGLVGAARQFAGDLTLPAWGVTARAGRLGAAFSTRTDIGTALGFASDHGAVSSTATHTFTSDAPTYDLVIAPTDGSPVGAGVAYRRTLRAAGDFVSLRRKIAANPEVRRLVGAPQAYVWGSGRTVAAVEALRDAGVDRMWLGYDADDDAPDHRFVDAASKAGYLVAPYDSWANAQDPSTSDAPTSTWPGTLFPDGCVRDAEGTPETGFGGRGCYLSSTALAAAQQSDHVLDDRVAAMIENGATSYFLDVDAAGQLFADSTPAHPQTPAEDRALRLARMEALAVGTFSDGRPLVLGSESAAAWANPAIAFSHGSSTPVFDGLWAAEQDRATWGAYWPEGRPTFFFGPTEIPKRLATAMFSPEYRIPLYETVLHDSVVSSERWELGIGKLPQVRQERALTAMLYAEPVMHTLDADNIAASADALAAEQWFFRTISETAGVSAMTGYERLTADGSVQRSTFGDAALTVTANFGTSASHGVDAGCVRATTADGATSTYCPSAD
jgi:hypothetical protein